MVVLRRRRWGAAIRGRVHGRRVSRWLGRWRLRRWRRSDVAQRCGRRATRRGSEPPRCEAKGESDQASPHLWNFSHTLMFRCTSRMTHQATRLPSQADCGSKQRAAISRILSHNPARQREPTCGPLLILGSNGGIPAIAGGRSSGRRATGKVGMSAGKLTMDLRDHPSLRFPDGRALDAWL